MLWLFYIYVLFEFHLGKTWLCYWWSCKIKIAPLVTTENCLVFITWQQKNATKKIFHIFWIIGCTNKNEEPLSVRIRQNWKFFILTNSNFIHFFNYVAFVTETPFSKENFFLTISTKNMATKNNSGIWKHDNFLNFRRQYLMVSNRSHVFVLVSVF